MPIGAHAHRRQLWDLPTATTSSPPHDCTPFTLPANGVLSLAGSAITLTTSVLFQPECTGAWTDTPDGLASSVADLKDPFYASTTPQTYVIAAATVIAWILVVMLIITPRTSFSAGPGTAPGFSNGHGLIGGANGGGSGLIGLGSRPWLQKAAALTVAVALTIATADTFQVAKDQYNVGYMNATAMRDKVFGSLEIRITRVISDVFVCLAQVQTLIRLFPRHKEKVLIKWIGFALIIFDSTFSCLKSFVINSINKPRRFADAIPALSYLFELALSLLYAAWVIYYALTKRRYAFYHHKMRSICLIAVLSLIAMLTPVVFFVTDVSNSDVAGWGDYFRWVGAAAASVVVWEWVERIEALEHDEKKDGILGREIFDGDEMLDVTPSEEVVWRPGRCARDPLRRAGGGGDRGAGDGNQSSALEHGFSSIANRFRGTTQNHLTDTTADHGAQAVNGNGTISFGNLPEPKDRQRQQMQSSGITPPPPLVSPTSRAETSSAASTVYDVRYEDGANVPQLITRRMDPDGNTAETLTRRYRSPLKPEKQPAEQEDPRLTLDRPPQTLWHTVPNPFKRKRASPPAEVQKAREAAAAGAPARAVTPAHNFSHWDLKNRLGVLAAETGERVRDRVAGRRQVLADFPVTVIPALPRGSGRAWSPGAVRTGPAAPFLVDGGGRQGSGGRASGSTARTSNSGSSTGNTNPVIASGVPHYVLSPPRAHDISPSNGHSNGADSLVVVPAPSWTSQPPRADDISPVARSSAPVVVPAPRRRSPLHISTNAHGSESGSSGPSSSTSRENG